MFACERKTLRTQKPWRPGRASLPLCANESQMAILEEVCANTPRCQHRLDVVSATVLWFESLGRDEQVAKVIEFQPDRKFHRVALVNDLLVSKVDTWRFPMHTRGHVITAATLAFCRLPAEQRAEWMIELITFLTCN